MYYKIYVKKKRGAMPLFLGYLQSVMLKECSSSGSKSNELALSVTNPTFFLFVTLLLLLLETLLDFLLVTWLLFLLV